VTTVTLRSQGRIDPEIREVMMLAAEAPAYIERAKRQNPYLTAFVSYRGIWQGVRRG
jgi:hypothetical protein